MLGKIFRVMPSKTTGKLTREILDDFCKLFFEYCAEYSSENFIKKYKKESSK